MFWHLLRSRRNAKTVSGTPRRPAFRPALETLETRLALATLRWVPNADGFFDEQANWVVEGSNPAVNRVPGPGDTAVASVGVDATITLRDARVLESINFSERLRVVNGGSLGVTAGSSNPISRLILENGGTIHVSGINTVLTPGDGSSYAGNVHVEANASLTFGSSVGTVGHNINPGASLTGPGQYSIGGLTLVIVNTALTLPANVQVVSSTFEAALRVSAGATVTAGPSFALKGTAAKLAVAGTFVVPGSSTFNWEGGSILSAGGTAGNLNIQSGGTVNIRGTGVRTLSDVTLNNSGTVNWPDAVNVQGASARFNNQAAGVFNVTENANLGEATWIITNLGVVNKSSSNPTSQTFILAQFNNTTGTVNVNSGQLRFSRGTNTSVINTSAGTQVLLDGDHAFNSGASYNGPGVLTVAGNGVFNANANFSVQNLELTTVLQGTGNLTVTGTLTWNIPGQMKGTGTTILAATGVANLVGNSNAWHMDRSVTNFGLFNWTGDSVLDMAAPFQNQPGGVFHAASDNDTSPFGGGAFHNAGTFRKSSPVGSGQTMLASNAFHNTGVVEVLSGTLALDQGGTSTGEFRASAGGILAFTSGTHTLNAGTQFNGEGTFAIEKGTVNVNANLTTATFSLNDGFLEGTGNFTITDVFTWTGGSLRTSTGKLTIAAGGTLTISGNQDKNNQERTIDLAGTANWSGAGKFDSGLGAVLNILASGIFNIENDEAVGAGAWSNFGTINKTGGPGTTTVSVFNTFTNHGTINVLNGTFDVAGTYNQLSGVTNVAAGAWLISSFNRSININGGLLTGNGSIGSPSAEARLTNSGIVAPGASAGTLTIHGDYTQTVTGRLQIQVGGPTPGTECDVLVVTKNATFGGKLELSLINGYSPVSGNTFQPVTYSARLNNTTFGSVTGATLAKPLIFHTNVGAANVTLLAVVDTLASTYVWVSHLYQDLLHRNGSDSEIMGWVSVASIGVSRPRIAQGFLGSLEYRVRVVKDLYQAVLGRAADVGSINNWVNFLATGGTPAKMRASLAASTEYFQRKGGNNNTGFVRALFRSALNRNPTSSELGSWVDQLRRRSRSDVATSFFTSTVHRQIIIRGLFTEYLRRSPTSSELTNNLNLLARGRDEDVINGLISSNQYFNRP